MTNLMALEMKKVNGKRFIIGGVVLSLGLIVYRFALFFLNHEQIDSVNTLMNSLVSLNKFGYSIFAALLMIQLFSEELKSKSMTILFTYPISRKELLRAKMTLLYCITAGFMFVSMLIHFVIFAIVNMNLHFVNIDLKSFGIYAGISLVHALLATFAAGIPFVIDTKKESSQITLVTAFVLSAVLYTLFSAQSNLIITLVITAVAAVVGIWSVKEGLSEIEKMDVL